MFVENGYDDLAASAVTDAEGAVKKQSTERAVGRAKVKFDGHKYLGWFVIIMASWVCLQASQCGSGDCRMDGARKWEDRDTHLKTGQPKEGQRVIESVEKERMF